MRAENGSVVKGAAVPLIPGSAIREGKHMPKTAASGSEPPYTVLIVEDNDSLREALRRH